MTSLPSTRMTLLVRLRDRADGHAWHEFLQIYEGAIYATSRKWGLQHADSCDLVQTVLQSVAKQVETWEPWHEHGSFRGWLRRVTRNHLISAVLARKRREQVSKTAAWDWNRVPDDANPDMSPYPQSSQSYPSIQNSQSTPQDFELDAEIVAEIHSMMTPTASGKPSTGFQISERRVVEVRAIEHKGSGLETYSQIQEGLNRVVALYQADEDGASRSELHAFSMKLARLLFRLQQLKRQSEIGGVEKRLGKLKELVAAREKMSDQIVNRRVSQLLGTTDGMGWDDLEIQKPFSSTGFPQMQFG